MDLGPKVVRIISATAWQHQPYIRNTKKGEPDSGLYEKLHGTSVSVWYDRMHLSEKDENSIYLGVYATTSP